MSGSTALVATCVGLPAAKVLKEIPDSVSMLEVRSGPADVPSANWLRRYFSGKLIYSALPNEDQQPSSLHARHASLIQAACTYDLVQLNADEDLTPEVLAAIPSHQRVICWKGNADSIAQLRSVFARISATPAHFYLLIAESLRPSAGVASIQLLQELGRNDVIAFCAGKTGLWSRILATNFGAPLIFGRMDDAPVGASGEPSVQQLIRDFGLPALHPMREIYGIVGTRVFQSPSPCLHNAGYRALGHPALFLPFYVECFDDFWREMIQGAALDVLGLSIKGLTIVSPYKEAAFSAAAWQSPMASRAGSSNMFLWRNGFWEAHTTDSDSVAGILPYDVGSAHEMTAAVIGCGGAGRAIAAALQQSGVQVTLVNRGNQRGELAVSLLGLPFVPLPQFQPKGFSLLVNATPVGSDDDSLPFDIDFLDSSAVVVDLVMRSEPTSLVSEVAVRGGTVVDGYDVLLNQVRRQFCMMTGHELPAEIGRETASASRIEKVLCAPEMQASNALVSPEQMAD